METETIAPRDGAQAARLAGIRQGWGDRDTFASLVSQARDLLTADETRGTWARDIVTTDRDICGAALVDAADAIGEYLAECGTLPDYSDTADRATEWADSRCDLYYSDAADWARNHHAAAAWIAEGVSNFGPPADPAGDGPAYLWRLHVGGQYAENAAAWWAVWNTCAARFETITGREVPA